MKRSIIYRSIALFLTLVLLMSSETTAEAKYYHDNIDNIFVHKNTDEKVIALTFDDGPHPKKTQQILDVLAKYNVKATFFVIGENAEKYPDILKKTYAAGHEIGNHTYDHKSIYKLSGDSVIGEVDKCTSVIESIINFSPSLFRPPEGFMDDTIARIVGDHGYKVILWKVDTYDWKGRAATDIYSNVTEHINCGDIILMHDYIWRVSYTPQALDMIIPTLLEQGYSFCTVSELIK